MDHVCDTDVKAHATPVGQVVEQGHRGAALFVCVQPECAVAGGHELLFATLEQWAAHRTRFTWLPPQRSTAWYAVVLLRRAPRQMP